ncbi:hypothetical protein [Clostridium brassicae]|uniref:Uncharacterized protein n=1 Tax=Clostridium brassicae TaxID=2999072 RepID=A0ABT4DGA9_9CLOT|nr:hypothetical protein [Clostridium brassicae]MCY6960246.1 hypothetical protein [Clostridium brassicae]
MKDNNLDRIIKNIYIEFNDETNIRYNIEASSFNIIMNKFHSNLNKSYDKR